VGYEVDDRDSIPGNGSDGTFSPLHRVQTGSEIHPVSYPKDTESSYRGSKEAGA
jgi:hypothetical protein